MTIVNTRVSILNHIPFMAHSTSIFVTGILLLAFTKERWKEEKKLKNSCKKRRGWRGSRLGNWFANYFTYALWICLNIFSLVSWILLNDLGKSRKFFINLSSLSNNIDVVISTFLGADSYSLFFVIEETRKRNRVVW